jgi:excisionase family DNA binding protein
MYIIYEGAILMHNLLSVSQVAIILKVHHLTVRRYIKEKRLKAVKVGGNVRIAETDVEAFHKEITITEQQPKIFKSTRLLDKQFTHEDSFFKLQGRGAGMEVK